MQTPSVRYPTSLTGWRDYHALCLRKMGKVTRSWVRRGVIATPAEVQVRARKSMQAKNPFGKRPGAQI